MANNHPKIRYASIHLIGQYSDDLKPHFQERYYDVAVPLMINLLQDPIPRVVSHVFACITNFFEDFEEVWKVETCLGQILPMVLHYLKNGNSWIK